MWRLLWPFLPLKSTLKFKITNNCIYIPLSIFTADLVWVYVLLAALLASKDVSPSDASLNRPFSLLGSLALLVLAS